MILDTHRSWGLGLGLMDRQSQVGMAVYLIEIILCVIVYFICIGCQSHVLIVFFFFFSCSVGPPVARTCAYSLLFRLSKGDLTSNSGSMGLRDLTSVHQGGKGQISWIFLYVIGFILWGSKGLESTANSEEHSWFSKSHEIWWLS